MKYLPLRELDDVSCALNFDTPDCHVTGSCDLYTTKAAGADKKLYRTIENSLESQYESLLRLSASLSPPHATSAASSLNLARSSPFGPLTQVSSRRTFAYLIATLNASHPDYDFSHILRPTDFKRERNLKSVMNTLDSTLYSLRPNTANNLLAVPSNWTVDNPAATSSGFGGSPWGPRMWVLIDQQMSLRDCSIYCYSPEEDPYDGEEGVIWSFNYFFFNKARKRVCYLYLRGTSVLSHSPVQLTSHRGRRSRTRARQRSRSSGPSKRADYWLGARAADATPGGAGWNELEYDDDDDDDDDDDADDVIRAWDDDEVDVEGEVLDDGDEMGYDLDVVDEEDEETIRERAKSVMRGISEEIVESMEV